MTRAIGQSLNTGPSVADLDAFAQLPDEVRALVIRAYGCEPEAMDSEPAPSSRARLETLLDDLKGALDAASDAIRRAEDEADEIADALQL